MGLGGRSDHKERGPLRRLVARGERHFDIAVPYIEWLILGRVALLVPNTKLMWDAKNMRFDNAKANSYLKPYVRKGWEMKL